MKHRVMRGALAAGLAGSLVASCGGEGTPDAVHAERQAVADRFGSCAVTAVVNTSDVPAEARSDGASRSEARVTLDIAETSASAEVRRKHAKDNIVYWRPPRIVANIIQVDADNPSQLGPAIATRSALGGVGIPDDETHPTVSFYPKTTYPAGTKAGVFAQSEAITEDDDTSTSTVGSIYCGAIMVAAAATVDSGPQWIVDPNPPALPKEPTKTETQPR